MRLPGAVVNLGHEIGDQVIGLHQDTEFVAPPAIHVKLRTDVGKTRHQLFRRAIAVNFRQRLIDRQIMAARGGAENAFDRMFEESAEAGFARGQALAGIVIDAAQHRQHQRQQRQDHQTGGEFLAQPVRQTKPDHGAENENRQRDGNVAARARANARGIRARFGVRRWQGPRSSMTTVRTFQPLLIRGKS